MNSRHTFKKIILASGSPYRRNLLTNAGVNFEVKAPTHVNESAIIDSDPARLAIKRASAKACAIALEEQDALIIGSDQTLHLEGLLFTKATSTDIAIADLKKLSGKTHQLCSAVSLVVNRSGSMDILKEFVVRAPMTMRNLSDQEIKSYCALGEWQGSVGGYKLEGAGVQLFQHIGGDFFTIVGLPLVELFAALRELGIDALSGDFARGRK